MDVTKKIKIGDLLLSKKLITQQQLHHAIEQQQHTKSKLGKILVDLGYIEKNDLLLLISQQLHIPFVHLKQFDFDINLVHLLSENQSRRYQAIVLKEEENTILIGMSDPQDIYAYDELCRILKKPLTLALVNESELSHYMDLLYRRSEEITGFAEQLSDELANVDLDFQQLKEGTTAQDAPVVKLLQSLFEDALQVNASDIHIEPDNNVIRIRQRIDGILYEHTMRETKIASALSQRLKLMAQLNIAEKRLPQDGRFNIKIKDRVIDVRLSTLPTQFGESVVMRLLDQYSAIPDLNKLGISEGMAKSLRHLIEQPHGMLLVTGPTGSGKTTTLYSLLNELNQVEKKIITVEDPIEYSLPRVNQVQVNPKIDLDFARVLRAILRQDPDIIMIGEIRDRETAKIGLQAAMTGHLVLATLHTNDAANSAMRLIDMGVESYLVASAVRAVLSQRLARCVCHNCKIDHAPDINQKMWLQEMLPNDNTTQQFKVGKGCRDCNHTGFLGRIGVYELLELDRDMLEALRSEDHASFHRAVATSTSQGMQTPNALQLAMSGIIPLTEAVRLMSEM